MTRKVFLGLVIGYLLHSLGSDSFLCAMGDEGRVLPDHQALFVATCAGDADSTREVLARNPGAINTCIWGGSFLRRAVFYQHKELVSILLEARADVNEADDKGNGLLHMAASTAANVDVVKELVRAKAEVNGKNNRGDTPLHTAAGWGKLDVARVLIQSGADLKAVNRLGYTPFKSAELSFESNKEAMKQLLIEATEEQRRAAGGRNSVAAGNKKHKNSCVVS